MDEPQEKENSPELDELRLMRFMDGRLDTDEQVAVQARLQQSPEDRRMLDALREESRLLREAVENLSEPPVKIGDKVLTVLRAEQRRRVALDHARRFRNRLMALTATAALLMVGLYFLSPRSQSGRLVSGTNASVSHRGTTSPLPKGGLVYDDDALITGRGQFVRLVLSSGCQVDVDEDSRVRIEKGAASLIAVENGRARVSTDGTKQSVLVRTFCGHIRAEQDTEFEFWVATPCAAQLPDWTGPWAPPAAAPAEQRGSLACLTVFRGTAYIHTDEQPRGFPVSAGRRVGFTATKLPLYAQEFDDWEALDSRREPWHALDGVGPTGLTLLGLYPPFNWQDLGERTGLLTRELPGGANVSAALRDAFAALAEAEKKTDAATRADQLSKGQQALRVASQGLPLSTELRWLERVIEGLAQYERGRCLRALGTPQALSDACGAYQAAAVAFHEALAGSRSDLKTDAAVAPGLSEYAAPKLTVSSRLADLTPVEQGLLLARFYLPWAQLAAAELSQDDETAALAREPLPSLFEQSAALLEKSVEGLAERLGRAKALVEENRSDEALATLAELRAFSVAGLPDAARAQVEGLRQAAHVETVRIYAARGEWDKVNDILDAFLTRYPLSNGSPAARQMEQIRLDTLRKAADEAFDRQDWLTATQLYNVLLGRVPADQMDPAAYWNLRVKHLQAALAADKGIDAARIARLLKADGMGHLDAATRARVSALTVQAEELFRKQRQDLRTKLPDSIQLDMSE